MNDPNTPIAKILRSDRNIAEHLIDAAPIIVLLLSPDGDIQFVNKHFADLTGYRLDEIRGKNWFEVFLPEHEQERIRKLFGTAMRGKATRGNVNPILTRRGEEILISWSDVLIRGGDGGAVSLMAVGTDVTRSKAIEEEKEASRQRLQNILDAMFVFVGLFDLDGNLVEANQPPLDVAGLGREDVIGKPFWDAYWWSYSARTQDQVRRALSRAAQGDIVREDFVVRIKGGAFITIDAMFGPLRDAENSITGVVGSGVDITDRKRAEQALRASRTHLALAQSMAEIGSWELDLIGSELTWSDEIYHMFEVAPGQFVPSYERFLSYVHPDDRAAVDRAYTESVASHKPYQIEHRILMPDGRIKFVEERCQTWYDDDEKPVRSVGTIQDITKRRHAEQEATQKSAILDTALEIMPQGFAVYNSARKVVAHNQKFVEMAGLPAGCRPLNMSHEDLLKLRAKEGKTVEPLTEDVIRRRVGRQPQTRETTIERVRADGTTFIYHRSPLPDGGYVVTYTDVTDMKRAEEHLRHSQKMLAIGQLTGGIAHDFNNLLAVIQGNADLLLDRLGPDDEAANAIIRASGRGAELTQRLLAFSRQQPLFPSVVDTKDLVREMAALLQRTLGETIEVTVEAPPELWPITVDRSQIENTILNLGINAKDAMPKGGKLRFDCANVRLDRDAAERLGELEAGEYVKIAIVDTGTGMSKEVLGRAFEPFFTTKDVGKGTGLGLSMVYGFVKQSGGHATIESEEGVGTAVTLYLPRTEGHPQAESVPPASDTPLGANEPVLVIEDNPAVCAVIEEILAALRYDVKTALDFAAAESILDKEKIRVVVSDVVLSGSQRGPEFAEKAKRRRPDLRFVFMSGYPSDPDGTQPIFHGDEVLLQKPFGRHELAVAVRAALQR